MKKIVLNFVASICCAISVSSQSLDIHLKNGDIVKFGTSSFDYADFSEKGNTEESDVVGVHYIRKGLLIEGQFRLYDSGTVRYNQNMSSFVYDNINPINQYFANGFAVPSSGYDHIAFVHYYNGDIWLGYEKKLYVERGPYFQSEDVILNVPNYCNKIIIITSKNYPPVLHEITSVKEKKLMKVTKTNNHIYVRTALNKKEDIITDYLLWENHNYTWNATYLGSNETTDEIILSNIIHRMGDSTGPLFITDPAPWHLWAQHGYCIPTVDAEHTLSSDDIGTIWKDQRNREYKIGKIEDKRIYLLPIVRETKFNGVYTRDWKSPTSNNNPEITSLTHVNGSIHTNTISCIYNGSTQLRPMMLLFNRKCMADGKEITEDGTYYCDEFVISEVLNCTDPWTVESWFPVVQKEIGAVLTETFTIHGLACMYDTTLEMKKSYIFGAYGANQVQHLVPINTMAGYDVYGMMPRAKKGNYAVPYLINDLNRSGEWVVRNESNLYDINKQPDRYISFFKNPTTGDMKIGCASGLSLIRGLTMDSLRNIVFKEYKNGDRDLLSCSPSNRNKAYFKVLADSHFENSIIPANYKVHLSTYLCYFDPMANKGQVYWYKDGDTFIIYAHYQSIQNKQTINLPKEMEGLRVEIVDKTDGITLLTDVIENGKLYINADANNHNYIVLKTK
jgi:hypothetical protein